MNPVIRFAERLAHAFNRLPCWRGVCRIGDLKFTADTFDRWLYLRLHRHGRMGRAEQVILRQLVRPGLTVLDVGGNIGLYTVALSRLVGPTGRVVTFEPDPELCDVLRRNLALNDCTNVEVHNLALGSRPDRLVLRRLILNSGDNTLGPGGSPHFRRAITTEVVALDTFLPALRPDLVKLDVQGWELEVLHGMPRLLATEPAPALYLEFWPEGLRRAGCTPEDFTAFLQGHGYQLRLAGASTPLDAPALTDLTRRLTGLQHADLYATR